MSALPRTRRDSRTEAAALPRAGEGHLLPPAVDRLAARVAPAWRGAPPLGSTAGAGRSLLRPLLAVLLAAVAVQSVLYLVNLTLLDLRIDRLHADKDSSLVGWTGTVLTWSAGLAAGLNALLSRGMRTPMIALAAACAFLSLDDMVQLHEFIAAILRSLGVPGHTGRLWPFVYLPLLGAVFWVLLRTARSVDLRTGRALVAGLSCLATAVVLEAAVVPVLFQFGQGEDSGAYGVEVVVEEALETTGWGLIAFGLLATAVDALLHRGAERVSAPDLTLTAGLRAAARPAAERREHADRRSGGERRVASDSSGAGTLDTSR